ncbi:hypothetical protein B9J07_12920 [Sinorhizobium sp. LM21]|uniref:hypothetical protein n=1 Tax=Sinorhizobium phage phiLM21 TaxID=1524882 RepID=UPI0004E5CC14|nr:hypothetical protein AWJ26_gp22 [Sinorhizobium phage phiLM21]AII27774.1 hypothetical protein phiLM21_p022 [Sinorhizobium phage phiLM21]OWZ93538.1 hypothetical protein B9J07_12920 [Sinorhizobium sp. LM21]
MSDTLTIPDEIAKRAARLINEAEDMRAQAVDDLKTIYGDLREELKALGWAGQNVSKEVAALKGAIAEMRLDDEKKAKREEKGDRVDDYVSILSKVRARAPARTRENIEQSGAGLDPKLAHTIVTGLKTETGRAALVAAVDILIEREEAEERRADAGLDIVTKHTEIAPASQGEAVVPSAEAETSGANEGGENVDRSATRAGLEGGPVNLEPTGPVAEWATDLADDGIRYEASPPRPMKSLPYAACFPELSHAHYQQLSDSIANNGVREPIVRMGDVIVDGWSRYNISRSLGIEYPVVSYLGNDVLLDVIAWQREARQFTPVQERQIAARLAKEVPHRASEIMRAFQIEEEFA